MISSDTNLINYLTFDIEEWFHCNFDLLEVADSSLIKKNESSNLEYNVDKLLDICDKHNVKSTCFIVGSVAKEKPYIVAKIERRGHEIASHGFEHKLIYSMAPKDFKMDLKKSIAILEDITGKKVFGFRAPSWSIKEENIPWYYTILEECGLMYSSSVYPGHTFLYGIPGFPPYPHHPIVEQKKYNILEVPVSVTRTFGKTIGFSGGFYLRLFPLWFIKRMINQFNYNQLPVVVYLHPREIDRKQPKLKLSMTNKFIYYWGIKNTERKINRLLVSFKFGPIKNALT